MTSRKVIEFAVFNVSDKLVSQPSLFQCLLESTVPPGRCEDNTKVQFYGLTVKRPWRCNWVMCYEQMPAAACYGVHQSAESQRNFSARPRKACGDDTGDERRRTSWAIEVDAPQSAILAALTAPTTEISHVTLKASADVADIKVLMDDIFASLRTTEGAYGGAWGFHSDDERKVSVVNGWRSIKDHKIYTLTEAFGSTQGRIRELFEELDIYHVELKDLHLNDLHLNRGENRPKL